MQRTPGYGSQPLLAGSRKSSLRWSSVGLGLSVIIATYSAPSIGDEIALGFYPRAAPAPEGVDAPFAAEIVVAHDLQSPASVGRTVRLVAWVAVEALVQVHATHGDTAFARVSRVADDLVLAAYLRSSVDPGGEAVEVPGEAHVFAVAGPDGYQYPEGPVSLVLAREGHGPAFQRRVDRVAPVQRVIDRVLAVSVVGLVAPSQAEVAVGELVPVVRLADDRVTRRDAVPGAAVRVPSLLRCAAPRWWRWHHRWRPASVLPQCSPVSPREPLPSDRENPPGRRELRRS